MANTTIVIGNLGNDPEITHTPSGTARAVFSVGDTPNVKNKTTGEWERGETDWVRCVAWGAEAETIAASFKKGTRVIVLGSYKSRKYQDTKTGEMRTSRELQVQEVGPTVKYQTIGEIAKTPFNGNGGGQGNYQGGQQGGYQQPQQQQAAPAQNTGGWDAGGFADEQPF